MSKSRRATIYEVATKAGVSVGTVSNVLTGRVLVAPGTRERVLKAMADLRYHPNRVARSLSLQTTRTLGMVIPDVANPFFAELLRGVEHAASEEGFCVIFGNSDNDPAREAQYIAEFVERQVDGLLLVITSDGTVRRSDHLDALPAVVALDRLPQKWQRDAVLVDNGHGVELAVDHLVSQGHRRIGFIGGDPSLYTERERLEAFRSAMSSHRLKSAWISEASFTIDGGRRQAMQIFTSKQDQPTALVCANDLLALGLIFATQETHRKIPEDISVVGFDDIAYARLAGSGLTTVHQPVHEMGWQGAQLIFQRLRGDSGSPRSNILRPQLVVRDSTAPPPSI